MAQLMFGTKSVFTNISVLLIITYANAKWDETIYKNKYITVPLFIKINLTLGVISNTVNNVWFSFLKRGLVS